MNHSYKLHLHKGYYFRLVITLLTSALFSCCLSFSSLAQTIHFKPDHSIPVLKLSSTDTLYNAWVGGVNAAQYSTVKLNDDNIEDLVVFDRVTYKISAFIAKKKGNGYQWKHAPEYETQFPAIRNWMLLVDYDHDGNKDLFTYTDFGVQVFRNTSSNAKPGWTLASDLLMTESSSGEINLSVLPSDIPAILDTDNDGDIDIIAGDGLGHVVYWYQNQSVERTGSPNGLDFKTMSRCWGSFQSAEVCGQFTLGITCGDEDLRNAKVEHAGSALLALDLNNDGLKDLLFSGVSCSTMAQLTNTGTLQKAQISSSSASFPSVNPVNFIFPAAFYEDLDFDGIRDLVSTPNVSSNDGNLLDFSRSNWYYRNRGTDAYPNFVFSEDNFLQNTMIDLGEMTFPALADYDGDNDLDLFVGNAGTPGSNGGLLGTLSLFENIGSKEQATFQLKSSDYHSISAFNASSIEPFFLDWNRDGATDLIVLNTTSVQTDLKIFLNKASAGQPFQLSTEVSQVVTFGSLRSNFVPCFYDFDGDGDWDMVAGKNLGELEYYQNTGSNTNPVFTLQNAAFANTPLTVSDRSQAPLVADLNGDGKPDLLSAYRNIGDPPYGGRLIVFPNITANANDSFIPQANIIFDNAQNAYDTIPLPTYLAPAAGDLDGDGLPDLVLGTSGGGLLVLKNTSLAGDYTTDDGIRLGPNPTNTTIYLTTEEDSEVSFFSLVGSRLMEKKKTQANIEIPVTVASWANGMYILRVSNTKGTRVRKIIVTR